MKPAKTNSIIYIISILLIFLNTSCNSSKEPIDEVIKKECEENNCYNHGECLNSGICACEDGYEAPYCSDCKIGYKLSPENKCIPPEEGMLYIKATSFKMGCKKTDDSKCNEEIEKEHEINLSAFQMDKYEVSVSKYKNCVDANTCTKPITNSTNKLCNYGSFSRLEHPVNCITWQQARDYCSFEGKHLPSEAQWELAATGSKKYRVYPWGNKTPSCDYSVIYDKSAGCNRNRTSIVGSKENGRSVYSIYDLAGNVWEWCEDTYDKNYYSTSPANNPLNTASGEYKVVRGGSFDFKKLSMLRNKYRGFAIAEKFSPSIGFRCVK